MKPFVLSHIHYDSVKALLSDLNIDIAFIRENLDEYFDSEDLFDNVNRWIDESPSSAPLLALIDGQEELALKFGQNILVAKKFLKRLRNYENEDNLTDNTCFDNADIKHIMCGIYVIQLLQDKMLKIDYMDYGFGDAKQMFYVLGAHIFNLMHSNDSREIELVTDGSTILNSYTHDVHGDFRLCQYDLSNCTMLNPFDIDELLPFGKPELVGSIAGYHSQEAGFLAGLLCFIHHNSIYCDSLANFDSYIESIKAKDHLFGNFADAGVYSSNTASINFFTFDAGSPVGIYTSSQQFYQAKIESGVMTYYVLNDKGDISPKKTLSIKPDMVEGLFSGLFHKALKRNGRTGINELEEVVQYYLTNYVIKAA